MKVEPLTTSCCVRSWFERYEFHVLAGDHLTDVPELADDRANQAAVNAAIKKNLALFIAKTDEGMYKLLKSLVSPKPVGECSYEECKTLILNHLAPAPTKFAQRYKLRSCVQESDESTAAYKSRVRKMATRTFIEPLCLEDRNQNQVVNWLERLDANIELYLFDVAEKLPTVEDDKKKKEATESLSRWMARIKDKATHCKFGTEYDNMVRNRFITGLRDNKIRTGLIDQAISVKENETISAEDILKKAIAKETANSSSIMNNGSSSSSMNKVYARRDNGERSNPRDRRDRKTQSVSSNSSKTLVCEQLGHTEKKCKVNPHYAKQRGSVHTVEQEEPRGDDFGMDESCLNVLDDELYSEYDDCCSVETSIENGNCNTCSYQCDNCWESVQAVGTEFSNMHVANSVLNSADLNVADSVLNSANSVFKLNVAKNNDMLIKVPNSNVLKSNDSDSTINKNNDDLCLDSDQWCCDINVTDVSKPYVEVRINGKLLCMEFDSGSSVSVVSRRTLSSCGLSNLKLTPSRKTLRVANGQIKTVEGCAVVSVELKGEKAHDMLLYVAEDFPSLFGRPWIEKFCGENWLDELLNTRLVNSLAPDKSQQVSVSCESCSGSGVQKGTVKHGWKAENTCTSVGQCRSVAQLKQSEVFKPGLGLSSEPDP
ncbi:hypothetical protein ACHWQZ_G017515 [Mnemiopsis leidyi]